VQGALHFLPQNRVVDHGHCVQHLLFSVQQLKTKELCLGLGLGRSQQGGPPGRERRASACRARTRSRRDQPAQHRGVTHGLRVVYVYVIGVREREASMTIIVTTLAFSCKNSSDPNLVLCFSCLYSDPQLYLPQTLYRYLGS